jgi:glycosyltransferase involved in cell wall biosynthesis
MKKPLISIIVPTRNSALHIETLLESIVGQNYKKSEVIIVDNDSSDNTRRICKKYGAIVVSCQGNPPLVAKQRNMGAKKAKGDYLYFMDHDMELDDNFINYFAKKIRKSKFANIDAWYVPEHVVAGSRILEKVRNFEGMFINGTVVSAARLIKKESYFLTDGYDTSLSGGPADWDFDIKLKLKGLKFALLDKSIYHHEEKLTLKEYILKKTAYIKGGEIYKEKWKKNNKTVYADIVCKQYGAFYRLFLIFIENNKWRLLIKNFATYAIFLLVKIAMSINYLFYRRKYV